MRFFLDANMPRSAIDVLRAYGHEVEFARDVEMQAAPDEQIAERARTTRAVLCTRDLDFADVRRYPPDQYAGLVILRLSDDATAQEIVSVLERFLKEPAFLDPLPGRLAIVERDRVRFRPPLA
jgi:predicted nuclease of predicted toxin-antitoxin system